MKSLSMNNYILDKPIRISIVSYLNSIPFRYGLENFIFDEPVSISLDIPSTCAQKLKDDEVDIGLIPVAMIPYITNAKIISEFCIGADGPVKTVSLYSNSPLTEIAKIYQDKHSRTSVALAKVLAEKKWNIMPEWIDGETDFEKNIPENAGGVVIGDKTFSLENKYKYNIDLAVEWKALTGLPFVFACWVSNKVLPDTFIENFNAALKLGVQQIENSVECYKFLLPEVPKSTMISYLSNNIDYEFNTQKKEALTLFLSLIKQ